MSFLPNDYTIPEPPSKYMDLEEGQNKIRILSEPIIGWEYWIDTEEGKRKPIRVKTVDEVPDKYLNTDSQNKAKHFWAFVVYNYAFEDIQILEVTQKGIMKSMEALDRSKDWGDVRDYDIVITKTKTGSQPRDVEYSVMPTPKKQVDKTVMQVYEDLKINLKALYKGEDPFAAHGLTDEDADKIDEAIGF